MGWTCNIQAQPFAFITNQGSDSVSVIDTETNHVIETIAVGHRPAGVVVSHNGERVYVSNPESRDISVIDITSMTTIQSVRVGGGPVAIDISPDDKTVSL